MRRFSLNSLLMIFFFSLNSCEDKVYFIRVPIASTVTTDFSDVIVVVLIRSQFEIRLNSHDGSLSVYPLLFLLLPFCVVSVSQLQKMREKITMGEKGEEHREIFAHRMCIFLLVAAVAVASTKVISPNNRQNYHQHYN